MNKIFFYPFNLKIQRILFIVFTVFFAGYAYGQNQHLADSLEAVYLNGQFGVAQELELLRDLSENHFDTDKKLAYSEKLIKSAQAVDSNQYIYSGYLQKGNALRLRGDLTEALANYTLGAKIAADKTNNRDLGIINIAMADVYSINGDHQSAIQNYNVAINILKIEKDSNGLASAYLNIGDEYFNNEKLDTAILFFNESERLFKAIKKDIGVAYNLGNIGLVYAKQGMNEIAEAKINQAISILEKQGDYYPICVYLTYMSDIYAEKGDQKAAMEFAYKSLQLSEAYGLKQEAGKANLKLSQLYEQYGNQKKAFLHFKKYIAYKDSVKNISSVQDIANIRTNFEVSQKQIEVDLLNQQKKNQTIIAIASLIAMLLIGFIAFGLFRRNKFIHETSQILDKERQRSDNLLLNILPEKTAEELKENGKVKAQRFESVTVLFTDFKGFSKYSENLSPEELVQIVDFYYSKFDEIMQQFGLEKIKTIGDAYMCAGGLPFPTNDHAYKIMRAAFAISEFVEKTKMKKVLGHEGLDVRIGINTGPVIAGVVGTKKFAYDIWGDTVNIAARMESSSAPGKINISENTYQLIKEKFKCTFRGEINVKSKGAMNMYFVEEVSEKTAKLTAKV